MNRRKNPPYVHEFINRHGTLVYYLRRPHHKKVRLAIPKDVLPWSPSFMSVYEAATTGLPASPVLGDNRTLPGTVNAALIGYYQSTGFTKGLAAVTQSNRRAILENFRRDHGDKRIALIHSQSLQAIMNGKTPSSQRNFKRALRGFIDYCMSHGLLKLDPLISTKMSKMKTIGHHTWTPDEIVQYQTRHAPGTKARLALELLLQTGHARSDVARMGPQHIRDGKLSMRRQKTNVAFAIPLLPDLVAELKLHTVNNLGFLISERGKPYGAASFGNRFRIWCDEAGLPHCAAHGLRKASAVRHAMNGATAAELMAWHGWKSISEVQRYIEEANRVRLSESAEAKMRTPIGPPANPVSQSTLQVVEKIG